MKAGKLNMESDTVTVVQVTLAGSVTWAAGLDDTFVAGVNSFCWLHAMPSPASTLSVVRSAIEIRAFMGVSLRVCLLIRSCL